MEPKTQSPLEQIVAERTINAGSDDAPIILRIGTPRPHPTGGWRCPYEITGLGSGTVKETAGADAVQALMVCIETAQREADALVREHERRSRVSSPPVVGRIEEKPERAAKTKDKPKAEVKTVTPDAALRAVVGDAPMSRKDITKRVWGYIKRHGLQDRRNRRTINADEKLRAVFDGRSQVDLGEVEQLIDMHVKSPSVGTRRK